MRSGSVILEGGCLCGAVRYRVSGTPYHQTLCHCSVCRRSAGAPVVAWFSVRVHEFHLLQGTPQRFRSSSAAMRTFCAGCGTQLTFELDGQSEIDVTTCSLDDPGKLPPGDQTFARSRLHWMRSAHLLPQHETVRPTPAGEP